MFDGSRRVRALCELLVRYLCFCFDRWEFENDSWDKSVLNFLVCHRKDRHLRGPSQDQLADLAIRQCRKPNM